MTEARANVLIAELGLVVLSSLLFIGASVRSWHALKRKYEKVGRQLEVEHLAWLNIPVPNQLDQLCKEGSELPQLRRAGAGG